MKGGYPDSIVRLSFYAGSPGPARKADGHFSYKGCPVVRVYGPTRRYGL